MAKDPAFLFFPGDWLGGTMTFSRHHKGAYMDLLMCQFNHGHMALHDVRIILGDADFDTMWETKLKAKFKQDPEGLFYNEKLESESLKRKKFTESRKKNLSHVDNHMSHHMHPHMENGDLLRIIDQLESKNKIKIGENEKSVFMYLVVEMVKRFTDKNPEYFFNKESDYAAALQIAYHIAGMKKFKKTEILNGKMPDVLASWDKIIEFIKKDEWLSTRSLTDLSTVKEWQRLVQKMSTAKKENDPTKVKLKFD